MYKGNMYPEVGRGEEGKQGASEGEQVMGDEQTMMGDRKGLSNQDRCDWEMGQLGNELYGGRAPKLCMFYHTGGRPTSLMEHTVQNLGSVRVLYYRMIVRVLEYSTSYRHTGILVLYSRTRTQG